MDKELTYQMFLIKYRLVLTDEMRKDLDTMVSYERMMAERLEHDSPRGEGG